MEMVIVLTRGQSARYKLNRRLGAFLRTTVPFLAPVGTEPYTPVARSQYRLLTTHHNVPILWQQTGTVQHRCTRPLLARSWASYTHLSHLTLTPTTAGLFHPRHASSTSELRKSRDLSITTKRATPPNSCIKLNAVRTAHFGMKLYDQRNAQVFNLFIYLRLPYMFRAFF
jgi:hypothetical protein